MDLWKTGERLSAMGCVEPVGVRDLQDFKCSYMDQVGPHGEGVPGEGEDIC
jgi:hypothetical protein